MPSFTLDGTVYTYDAPVPPGRPETARSWVYGHYPKVTAVLPSQPPVTVHARAARWNGDRVLVEWEDDDRRKHWTWVGRDAVVPVSDVDWDVWEFGRAPEHLRGIRWGERSPGDVAG